jgi:hypothetical protein
VLTDERDVPLRAGSLRNGMYEQYRARMLRLPSDHEVFLRNYAEGEWIAEERSRLCTTIDATVSGRLG